MPKKKLIKNENEKIEVEEKSSNEVVDDVLVCEKDNNQKVEKENDNLTESSGSENIDDIEDIDVDINSDGVIPESIVDDKMKNALEAQTPKKKRRSLIINLCLLAVNIVFMYFIVKKLIANVGDVSLSNIIKNQGNQLWWLLGAVGAYALFFLTMTLSYNILLKKFTGKSNFKLSYDVAVQGKYYDNVTPFAVGGQPMQIVRFSKNGISPGVATSIPLIKMIIYSTINTLFALAFFLFGLTKIPLKPGSLYRLLFVLLVIVGVIGLVISAFTILFMFVISSGSLITRSFVSGLMKPLYKLHLIKNYRQSFNKVMNQVAEYKYSMSYLKKNKLMLLKLIIVNSIECLAYSFITYFVVMAFASGSGDSVWLFMLVSISKYFLCAMASSYIPLPGGTGIMEIAFVFLFCTVMSDVNIVWALLIWRFFTYYLIIIHGFIHEIVRIISNFIKSKRNAS